MRAKHFLTAACIAAIALGATTMTSCNRDNDEPVRDEVKIVTSVNGASDAPQLRAALKPDGSGNLENGDKIGLTITGAAPGNAFTADYTIGTTTLYWDDVAAKCGDAASYAFLATFPVMQANAWNAATQANPDLLTACVPAVAKGAPANLVFNHVMHKLVVNLTSNVYSDTELATATVTPKNLKSTVTVKADGTADAASGTDAYPAKTGAGTSHIVAPQTGLTSGTALLTIDIQGKAFTYNVPSGLTELKSGQILTLNLSITRDAVILTGKNVTGWGSQGTENGEIEFN